MTDNSARTLLSAAITLSAALCAHAQTRSPEPARMVQPAPSNAGDVLQRAGGSLLRATAGVTPDPNQAKLSNISFFAVPDPAARTFKKHDLVTIIVQEVSESKSEGTTDLKKQADFDAKITQFLKLNRGLSLGASIGSTVPEIDLAGQRNLKGEATVDRSDSLTMNVTAEVLDVKPNGTLVLQARQHIKTDDEDMTFVLAGTCRVEDITPDNTVLSTQMFDKDVSKVHKGMVRDTTRRGWVPKLIDVINPF